MPKISNEYLHMELTNLNAKLDTQIVEIERKASSMGIKPWEMLHIDGKFALTDMLAAKAQVVSSLVLLNDKLTKVERYE